MKKHIYSKKRIIGLSVLLAFLTGVFCYMNVFKPYQYTAISTGMTKECYHDDSYTEPILRNGNYCLKDSTLYLHIDEDNIQLCGSDTDLLNFSQSLFIGYESDIRVHLQEEHLKFWETPQKYVVKTIHGFIMNEISPTYEAVFIRVPYDRTDSVDIRNKFACDLLFIDQNTIQYGDKTFTFEIDN